MLLHDTVTRFCTEEFYNVFDSAETFLGKVNVFAEVTNSGVSSMRRVLETPPDTIIPTSWVVVGPDGRTFIVGAKNIDYWDGTPIRYKYATIPVTYNGQVGTIGEVLEGSEPTVDVYGYPYFVRRELSEQDISDYLSGFELYLPNVFTFTSGDIWHVDGTYYRLKTDTWLDGIGFSVSQVVKLEDPVRTFDINLKGATYDPVTDGYPTTVVTDVLCFVEPMVKDYDFVTPAFDKIEPGDKAISTRQAVGTGDSIGDFRVTSVRDMGGWYTCHCRYEN